MKYFQINTLGDSRDKALAFISSSVENMGLYDYTITEGERAARYFPEEAEIYLQPNDPGIKLTDFIGNAISCLIVNTAIKDTIIEYCPVGEVEIEMLPFTLINHKKRVHSTDYWIINPIGTFDCVNRSASEIEFLDDEIVGVDKYVFDPKKLENAPHLFRVPEDPTEYFISQNLAKAFQEKQFTNIFLIEIEQSEED